MGMWGSLVERIAEHVIEEAQEAIERLGREEHMFGSLRRGSDGTGVLQGILHHGRRRWRFAGLLLEAGERRLGAPGARGPGPLVAR